MNKLNIDLKELNTAEQVLRKFGKVFEFGGSENSEAWGKNWDALFDSFTAIETGGISGTSKKFSLPLDVIILNYSTFKESCPEDFKILNDVLRETTNEYEIEGKQLHFRFE